MTRSTTLAMVGLLMVVLASLLPATHGAISAKVSNSTNSVKITNYTTCLGAMKDSGTRTNGLFGWAYTGTSSTITDFTGHTGVNSTIGWSATPRSGTIGCSKDIQSLLLFDGTIYNYSASNSIASGLGAFTEEVWFRYDNQGQTHNNEVIVAFSNVSSPLTSQTWLDRVMYIDSTGKLRFGTQASNTAAAVTVVSPGTVTDKNWHHAVGVREANGTLRLYLDGVQVATATGSTLNGQSSGGWLVGSGRMNTNWPGRTVEYAGFLGNMSHVGVYNYAMSAGEVAAHYAVR